MYDYTSYNWLKSIDKMLLTFVPIDVVQGLWINDWTFDWTKCLAAVCRAITQGFLL